MKKSVLLFLFFISTIAYGQFRVNGFEDATASAMFNHPVPGNLNGLGTGGSTMTLTDATDVKHGGNASLKVEWFVNTTESYGGFAQMMHLFSVDTQNGEYYDFSMADHLSIWYNNTVASTQNGSVHMRFKLHEAGGEATYYSGSAADHEDWYFETAVPYDETPGWKELKIPLKMIDGFDGAGPNAEGFSLPGWSGTRNNGEMDLDKIVGYSIECTAPVVTGNEAYGTIYWDDLTLQGSQYPPIETFDNVAAIADYYKVDNMSWGTPNASLTVTDEKTDVFEGESSLKIDYKVNANQSWGGYVNMEHIFPEPIKLDGNTNLYCAVKNLIPNELKGRLQFRFVLYDDASSVRQSWMQLFNVNIDSVSDWTMVKIPLEFNEVSSWDLVKTEFINPPDQGNPDTKMDLASIAGYKIEFSVDAEGPVGADVYSQGSVLVDFIIPAGYRETDVTPPAKVEGITAIASNFVNLVTWNDVTGEAGEKYSVYYSTNPITDVEADGVEVVKLKIEEGTGLVNHLLRAPATDQNVTYYYAIVCIDKAGNKSEIASSSSSTTNLAKGVPVVSLTVPTSFAADGSLDEWNAIIPIELSIDKGTAFLAPNTKGDGDADLSAKAYVAIDANYLYVAFDVTDDAVVPSTKAESYLNDAVDLFIGLYDWHGPSHVGLMRGAEPDYHLRFCKTRLLNEGGGGEIDSLLTPGANYYWEERFPSGYVIEAKISLNDLMNKRNSPDALKDQIMIREGMRVPIDFSVNDNDTGEREGILCYSPNNQDFSYQDVSRWYYTWIGDKWNPGTGVEEETIPEAYSLLQNYPNPFNPTTTIKYSVAAAGFVTLKVYDVLGRQVMDLVNRQQDKGNYTVSFNGSNLSTGVYFYKLESGNFSSIKKMMLIK
ncbi:MAG: T9SS type A sorting domain-containing protein [Melioribacteraceae bacterium]|nr:T9SS type A sorting domain-containing protein [Melioribacteraceae bacterium]